MTVTKDEIEGVGSDGTYIFNREVFFHRGWV